MRGLNLHRLQIFRTVFETLNVSATAKQMRLSQPTVSRHIAIFEDELGIELFRKASGRLEPTWEAQRLYSETRGFFGRLEHVEQTIASIRRGDDESLRIMSSMPLSLSIVPQAIGQLHSALPDLDIVVDGGPLSQQLAALREGELDIAIGGRQVQRTDLRQTHIGNIPLAVMVPSDHRLAQEASFDLAWLDGLDCVLHNESAPLGRLMGEELTRLGVEPKRAISAFSILFAGGLAKSARLFTVADQLTLQQFSDATVKIIPVRQDISLDLSTIEMASQPERRSVQILKKKLRQVFTETLQTTHR